MVADAALRRHPGAVILEPMSRLGALALVALGSAAGCVDVPPHCPGTAGDCDGDGWPAVGVNPAASDCDDQRATVNPGAADDPTTAIVEDCFATALGPGLDPVVAVPGGWRVGDRVLEFDGSTMMPSSLRLGATEFLAGNTSTCVADERFAGVSLYPAFGVDRASTQVGAISQLRGGPVIATSQVTWSQDIPMAATLFGCDAATRVTGTIDFTMQATGRVVRHDRIVVDDRVATCAGCADPDGNAPYLTSYTTFPQALDRYQVEPAVMSTVFPGAGTMAHELAAPAGPVAGCVSGGAGASASVGIAWWFPTEIAGLRARTTADARVNHAMVVDWVRDGAVVPGTYELVTALAIEDDDMPGCSPAQRTAMAEFAQPPALLPTTFVAERGTYRYTGAPGAGVVITADQGVTRGAVIEIPSANAHGVTVWRSMTGGYQRLRRGLDYLVQIDANDTTMVYLPSIPGPSTLVIAGPGGEPSP